MSAHINVAIKTFFYHIIDAWKNGGACNVSCDQTTSDSVVHTISVNTTFSGGGKFICNLCGHEHSGGVAYMTDDEDNVTTYRIVVLPTTSAAYTQNTGWWVREDNDVTQDCLNCIIYDYNRDKVKIIRFGSVINNDIEECKAFTF